MRLTVHQNLHAVFYAPFYVAVECGFFGAQDLEVTITTGVVPIGSNMVAGREPDLLFGGPIRAFVQHAENPESDLQFIAEVVRRDPFMLIGRKANETFRLADLADLSGKRVGLFSLVETPALCLTWDLLQHGVGREAIARFAKPTIEEAIHGLRGDRFDVIQVPEPYASDLIMAGEGHLWHAAARRGPTSYSGILARKHRLNGAPGLIVQINEALAQGCRYVLDNPGEKTAGLIARHFPTVREDVLATAIDRYSDLGIWAPSADVSSEGLEALHRILFDLGILTRTTTPAQIVL